MGKCFGITRNLNRCKRDVSGSMFCPEHRRQPLIWFSFLIFTVGGGLASVCGVFSTKQDDQLATAIHDKEHSYLKGPLHVTFQDGKTYDVSFGFNYRIVDPLKFHTNAGDFNHASRVLVPLVRVALISVLESHSSASARIHRAAISSQAMKEVSPRFLESGLELSDLGIESFHE